jgi:cytidylate kinase
MLTRPITEMPHLSRVIEKQMRNWEIGRAQRPEVFRSSRREASQFITIANICGAGGNEVAQMLSERLGWPVFDRQILTLMARDDEVRESLYRSMDERDLSWFEGIFRTLTQQEFRKNDYFHRLTQIILWLARQGPAIYVGRSVDLILPKDKGLRVKVIASMERCIENFVRFNNTTPEQAKKEIDRIERERREFVEHHFHIDPYSPTRFDLLVRVDRFTTSHVVDLITCAMKARGIAY